MQMFSNNGSGQPMQNPWFLHGWDLLYIVRGNADAPMLRELALDTGPAVVYNSHLIATDRLEDPDTIVLWLAPILHKLCCHLLDDSLKSPPNRRFASRRWIAFRNTLCRYACMSWENVVAAARREGIPWMADTLVEAVLFESGFLDRVEGRRLALFDGNVPPANDAERLS